MGEVYIESVPLAEAPAQPPPGCVLLRWLGQAGFLLRSHYLCVVIDPYLSDSLARRYRGAKFPHKRMMPPPVQPAELGDVDFILCTHAHTDHMDGETIRGIMAASPKCGLIVPAALRAKAGEIRLPADRVQCITAGECLPLREKPACSVSAYPSAHETLQTDEAGEPLCVGYRLGLGDGPNVYHSGDCVPYSGLGETLSLSGLVEVALLPVNGRDEARRAAGVLGNFTFGEAVALCREAEIPLMIPHHFGMFEFNTVDPGELRQAIERVQAPPRVVMPNIERVFILSRHQRSAT